MHADTPPESIHMMDASELAIPAVQFFVAREAGQPLAMGAFKALSDPNHAEIKSMHVLAEARGRGMSKAMLAHVEATARAAGITRLSLETGVQPTFIAARALYERAGYSICGPFEGYWDDPNSLFMTKSLV
jgi:putative acetyltransferase